MNNVANADNKYVWHNGQWVKAAFLINAVPTSNTTAANATKPSKSTSSKKSSSQAGSKAYEYMLLGLGGVLILGVVVVRFKGKKSA
jgi:hypothetical protein